MPQYSYTCEECNTTVEKLMSMHEDHPSEISCECGGHAHRDFAADLSGRRKLSDIWPIHSEALGVDPESSEAAQAEMTRLGVPTEFLSDGRPVLRDRKHRKEVCEALGYFDRNGGYSDPQPQGARFYERDGRDGEYV